MDISSVKLGNGITAQLKDEQARCQLASKQKKLIAGNGITIDENGVISAEGGGIEKVVIKVEGINESGNLNIEALNDYGAAPLQAVKKYNGHNYYYMSKYGKWYDIGGYSKQSLTEDFTEGEEIEILHITPSMAILGKTNIVLKITKIS